MTLIIEIDKKWTVGIDWFKHVKGFRLGFFAIHVINVSFENFMGVVSEDYYQKKIQAKE